MTTRPPRAPNRTELRTLARHVERAVWKLPPLVDRDAMTLVRDRLGLNRDIYAETIAVTGIDPEHATPALLTVHLP